MNWKLAPCPFCGATADDGKLVRLEYVYHLDHMYEVKCNKCGASGGMSELRDEAVWLWNRRVK